MVETGSFCQLLQHNGFLHNLHCDYFSPDNNNVTFTDSKDVATVIVLDNVETNLPAVVAFGAMKVCANNQVTFQTVTCNSIKSIDRFLKYYLCKQCSVY